MNKTLGSRFGVCWVISLFLFIVIVPNGVRSEEPVPYEMIMRLQGGVGRVSALVDSYYAGDCFKFVPIYVHLKLEGKNIQMNGETDQLFPGRTRGFVHSGPVFGFGSARIVCEAYHVSGGGHGMMIASRSRSAIIIGFVVIGLV